MIKAKFPMKDGRQALVLGLSEENIRRMKQGQPIYFDIGQVKIQPSEQLGVVTVFYGRDEDELLRTLGAFIGPTTDVIVVPKGDKRPT